MTKMPDKKLKDNEIKKVLECCIGDTEGKNCFDCPLYEIDDCQAHMYLDALDLINRQKAELKVSNEALNNSIKLNNRLQSQNKDLVETVHNLTIEKDILFDKAKELKEVLLKYHPSKFYPVEISTPYGIFFCKKEEDYKEFKSKIQQDFIKYAKEYFKDSYFAYDAEQKCEELDDILKEMENTIYDD